MGFSIYRFNPEQDGEPYMQHYDVALQPEYRMLLDALIRIKSQDDSLTFRKSCREGVCGSDAMNINGRNGLACVTRISELREPVELHPLPGFPVTRNLVVDMTRFFRQHHSIKPYVINDDPPPEKERQCRPQIARNWMACMNAYFALAAPAFARLIGGIPTSFSDPRRCCRPIVSWQTAATGLPRSAWIR